MERVVMNSRARAFMDMPNRAASFIRQVEQAAAEAATEATEVTQATFRSRISGRPFAPARRGRPTTGGEFGSLLRWQASGDRGTIGATFDFSAIASRAPYWIIQEIGTGRGAKVYGGPAEEYTIPSQVGRKISRSLEWASSAIRDGQQGTAGPGGKEQLFLVPPGSNFVGRRKAMAIQREIKGKHMVQAGGQAGFSMFAATVRAAADNLL